MAQIIPVNGGGGAGGGGGEGDMKKSVYDPNNKNADAFDYDNFENTPNLSVYQTKNNLVTNLTDADDTHYPSAKAVADAISSSGGGDMSKSVYDPTNVNGDAFDYDKFHNVPAVKTFELTGLTDYTTMQDALNYYLSGGLAIVMYGGIAYKHTSMSILYSDVPRVFSASTITVRMLVCELSGTTVTGIDNPTMDFNKTVVVDNLTSTSATSALSANQGKILNDKIADLFGLGKFLSTWDATTGQPDSFPLQTPYTYTTGDYYLVSTISSATPPVNYKPSGSSYTGTASSTTESGELAVGDIYIYDGTNWLLQLNHGKTVSFSEIAGNATDNTSLSNALATKANDNAVVKLTGDQTIAGTKTFSTSPVVPSKTTDATNTGTAIATEAQVAKKQDALTLPATPTQGNLVVWGADNETLVDGGAVPTGLPSGGTNGQVVTNVNGVPAWANPTGGHDYSWVTKSGTSIQLSLRTLVSPTANFTLTVPSTIQDGMEYVIRCVNTTSYTMTLGTGFTNPWGVDLTLSSNASDQFVFVAINGTLELQPEPQLK